MAPDKPDPTPAEIEQLQYECHPFPAYVDYIYGRPTEYERMMTGVNGTGYGGIQDGNLQVHAGNAPAPVANASAPAHWPSQLERRYVTMNRLLTAAAADMSQRLCWL